MNDKDARVSAAEKNRAAGEKTSEIICIDHDEGLLKAVQLIGKRKVQRILLLNKEKSLLGTVVYHAGRISFQPAAA